jgi:hypothetical protein
MSRTLLISAIFTGTLLCLAGAAWAQDALGSNPPTFQNIGMLDTVAWSLAEADCRTCHSSGVPDRHHLLYGEPIPEGSLVPYPDSDGDGVDDTIYGCLNCHAADMSVVRDCVWCHNIGSPHHTLPAAVDLQCTSCHGDLVDNPYDGHYVPSYAPSLVTPYRGLDGDGWENPPWRTPDLTSDGSGLIVPADATVTVQGPPFFAVTNIGALGTIHTRSAPHDLSFKPVGSNNDFVIGSIYYRNYTYNVVFTAGSPLAASWDAITHTLSVTLDTTQTANALVNVVNAATGGAPVLAELGFDGDDAVADLLAAEHYEPAGGDPANHRGFGAGSCSYCHGGDGFLDSNGDPNGLIWDNRTLHHEIGLPAMVNDGMGGTISRCDICHERATDDEQSGPNFDYAIRHCERCHGPDSLHNIQADSPNPNSIGTIVVGGEYAGFGHVGRDAGPGDSDCWGCHGFGPRSAGVIGSGPVIPTLRATDLAAVPAGRDTQVLLTGSGFANESDGKSYKVDVRLTAADGSSITLKPEIVDQGLMYVTIPGEVARGNYDLQAVKDDFSSNPLVISVTPEVIIADATVSRGRVTIQGSGFGGYVAGSGTEVSAKVGAANGKNRAHKTLVGTVVSWSDTTIVADFVGRPREVTVASVYGMATRQVVSRGGPTNKPKE